MYCKHELGDWRLHAPPPERPHSEKRQRLLESLLTDPSDKKPEKGKYGRKMESYEGKITNKTMTKIENTNYIYKFPPG